MKKIVIILSLCLGMITSKGICSDIAPLPQAEMRLAALFAKIMPHLTDEVNLTIADSIACLFHETLLLPGAFKYPFNNLKAMGKITSANQKIRLFTWNIPNNNGSNNFYGFLLYKTGNGDNVSVFQLTDSSRTVENPAVATLTADSWYGCLIYTIVEKKISGETYYTLLGYHPENIFITKKLVDILWFNDNNEPRFGKAVFHYNKQMQCRILFTYSAKVQMSLKWNDNKDMIIYDHLSPSTPSYAGNFQYYGPDFSYDALKFEKGVWEMVEDVDARNGRE